jgi:hypothetical protein
MLTCFQPTPTEVNFFRNRLRLPYKQYMWGCRPSIASRWNSKKELRLLVEHEGLPIDFPEYAIVELANEGEIYRQVGRLLTEYPGAFIKHPDSATGEDMQLIDTGLKWQGQVARTLHHLSSRRYAPRAVVVDAYEPGVSTSVQMEVCEDGPRVVAVTLNRVQNRTKHCGNVVASSQLPGVPDFAYAQMVFQSEILGWALWRKGYRGHTSVDFVVTDRVLCLEINARATGGMYPTSVGMQLQANGYTDWAVSWNVMKTPHAHDFASLSGLLRAHGLLCNGHTGILPAVIIPLSEEEGGGAKVMVCSIAEKPDDALAGVDWLYDLTNGQPA